MEIEEEYQFAGGEGRLLRLCFLVLSTGGLSTMLLFDSFGKRSYQKLSHWRSGIGLEKGGCWLVEIILVEGADQLL